MRLLLHAIVDRGESSGSRERLWIGVKHVERPYSRVPSKGEGVRLGDNPDSLGWPVDHVLWENSGLPSLTLSFEEDDPEFHDAGAIRILEEYGFRRLVRQAAPTE